MGIVAILARRRARPSRLDGQPVNARAVALGRLPMTKPAVDRLHRPVVVRMPSGYGRMATGAGIRFVSGCGESRPFHEDGNFLPRRSRFGERLVGVAIQAKLVCQCWRGGSKEIHRQHQQHQRESGNDS